MENLKDQQIESQKETIQSLERKVESLENELQKFLDPDSGTIRPEWKPKSKHGEQALLQQVQTLQKELDECLEAASPLISDDRLEQRLWNIINTAFLPVRCYNSRKKEHGIETQPWWYFREFLFESELFNDYWPRPEFRLGVDLLNDICQATETAAKKLTRSHLNKFDFAGRMFGGSGEWREKKIVAMNELTAALWLIIENYNEVAKTYVGKDDLYDMMAALKIVAFCQRLLVDARPEEKEAEQEVA